MNKYHCCRVCGRLTYTGTEWDGLYDMCEECLDERLDNPRLAWDWKPAAFSSVIAIGPHLCRAHAYPVRYPDGQGKLVCLSCITRLRDPNDLVQCSVCRFLVDRHLVQGDSCRWCALLGKPKSLLLAMFPGYRHSSVGENFQEFLVSAFWNDEKNDWETVSHKDLEDRVPGGAERMEWLIEGRIVSVSEGPEAVYSLELPTCLEAARVFSADMTFEQRNFYEDLVEELDNPRWRRRFSRHIAELEALPHKDGSLWDVFDCALQGKVRYYWGEGLDFIAFHEADRFAQDPESGDVFRVLAEPDPVKRLERSLATGLGLSAVLRDVGNFDGREALIGRDSLRMLLKAVARETGEEHLLSALCRRFPEIPRLAWVLLLLFREYDARFSPSAIEAVLEDQGLFLALVNWDLWYRRREMNTLNAPLWWRLAEAWEKTTNTSIDAVLEQAWDFGTPRYEGPLPDPAHREVLASQATLEPLVDRKSFESGTIVPWNNWLALHLLLSGRRPEDVHVHPQWRVLLGATCPLGSAQEEPERKEVDRRFISAVEAGNYFPRVGAEQVLACFSRTGNTARLLPLLRERFEQDTAWWPAFAHACLELAPEQALPALPALEQALRREVGQKQTPLEKALHLFNLALVQGSLERRGEMKRTSQQALAALRLHVEGSPETEDGVEHLDAHYLERLETLWTRGTVLPEDLWSELSSHMWSTRDVDRTISTVQEAPARKAAREFLDQWRRVEDWRTGRKRPWP